MPLRPACITSHSNIRSAAEHLQTFCSLSTVLQSAPPLPSPAASRCLALACWLPLALPVAASFPNQPLLKSKPDQDSPPARAFLCASLRGRNLNGRTKGEIDQRFFFDLVGLCGTGGGGGTLMALHAEDCAVASHASQQRHNVGEGAHVGRLFLYPDDLLGFGMLVERCLELGLGPGIHLLEEDDADAEVLAFGTLDAEVVADLATADEEAARVLHVVVGENILESFETEVRD